MSRKSHTGTSRGRHIRSASEALRRPAASALVRSFSVVALATCLLIASCFGSLEEVIPEGPELQPSTAFTYNGWNFSGSPILSGTLTITGVDSSQFVGVWEIHWAPGADTSIVVGPQVGSGSLTGEIVDGRAYLTLTRGDSSGAVTLNGIPDDLGWHGRWGYVRPSGLRTGGSFVATLSN